MKGFPVNAMRQAVWIGLLSATLFGCAKYKEQIASQKDEIQELNSDKTQLQAQNESLEADKAKLSAEKDGCENSRAELETKIADLNEQIKGLEEDIASMDIRKAELSKDLQDKDAALKELQRQAAQSKKRLAGLKQIVRKFKKLIKAGKLNVKIRRGKMVLELPSAILFESGKAGLSDAGKETLAEVAKVLANIRGQEFQVSGHTDNVPITSKRYRSNWQLSTERALSVVEYLESEKVNPKVLSVAGYSQYQPAASNATDKGKAANRRIEIVLMPNLKDLPDLTELEKELSK